MPRKEHKSDYRSLNDREYDFRNINDDFKVNDNLREHSPSRYDIIKIEKR